jgi:hypothetical protein
MPEGIFSYQKYYAGYILKGLGRDNVGIVNGHLEYSIAVCHILWGFLIHGHLVILCVLW